MALSLWHLCEVLSAVPLDTVSQNIIIGTNKMMIRPFSFYRLKCSSI